MSTDVVNEAKQSSQVTKADLETTIDSAMAICQQATLLACNKKLQACDIAATASWQELPDVDIQVKQVENHAGRLSDKTIKSFEKLNKIQQLLSQIKELNIMMGKTETH